MDEDDLFPGSLLVSRVVAISLCEGRDVQWKLTRQLPFLILLEALLKCLETSTVETTGFNRLKSSGIGRKNVSRSAGFLRIANEPERVPFESLPWQNVLFLRL